MNNLAKQYEYLEKLVEQVKDIDTDELSDEVDNESSTKVIEEQKIFFWVRLYLSEEDPNINIGDDVNIEWSHSGEKLKTKFAAYGKEGVNKDQGDEMTNYNPEDDKRILCLMIDTKMVNFNDDIPFIRTLFKTGYHYEYQLVKRNELTFTNERNGMVLDYFDCDF
jgi:hypothetical protein